jgi:energy-coupling factor transporter ATP-binding protein EcfA2
VIAGTSLAERVRALLAEAAAVYRDRPRALALVRAQLTRLDEPVRVAVAGRSGTGKSTLVTALDARVSRHSPGRDVVFLDLPPLAALGEREEDPVVRQLAVEADAVVFLTRHPEAEQLSGLPTAAPSMGSALARQTAVTSILALSRADEVGAGRIDALIAAKQLARRSRTDDACAPFQTVVAVAGQLALGAITLQENEFAALALLASVPRADLDRYLLSVDEFVSERFPVRLDQSGRRVLLAKFGLFGVRLTTTLIRTGCDSAMKLSAQLVQRSGFTELRDAVDTYFVARGDVVKARTALLALETMLDAEPHRQRELLTGRLEQIAAGAHDFRELRLIAALHSGRVDWPEELATEARCLVGAHGIDVADRLGLDGEPDEGTAFATAIAALGRWRHRAEAPDTAPAERTAARVVVRSCEGILARFD